MSLTIEVVLDDQGRLVLPPDAQRELGLTQGMTLVVEQETVDLTYLRVQPEQARLVDREGSLVIQLHPLIDLDDIVRHERDQRVVDLVGRLTSRR